MSTYLEFEPAPTLRPFVHRLWTYETVAEEPEQVVVPDGHPELVVHLANPYREGSDHRLQPVALFAGQLTRPLTLVGSPPASMVGARFHPYGARAFLGFPVDMTTDRRVDLKVLDPSGAEALQRTIKRAAEPAIRLERLSAYLLARLGGAAPDPVVQDAVRALKDEKEPPSHHLSPRQFQRRFKRETGVSLKTLRSVFRFRAVFDRLSAPDSESWARRALEAGYFDQPQLARDFKRYLGCSAREWMRRHHGLAKAIASTPQHLPVG